MISRAIIDLMNSDEGIAIIGSGVSCSAGLPTWNNLFDEIANNLNEAGHNIKRALNAKNKHKLPEAFEYLSELTSRAEIHNNVSEIIERYQDPSPLHSIIADWPFRFYITTNYDHLLEKSSNNKLTPVGNNGNELYKMTHGARDVVWHIHGGSALPDSSSHLVVTRSDYTELYPSSTLVDIFKSISTIHRCIFIGFGFNDQDLKFSLEAVGRITNTGKPSYAFIGYENGSDAKINHQEELRYTYNVEVIPYQTHNGNHSDLFRVINCHTPFLICKSISLGQIPHGTPSYDNIVSSLKIQSILDLGELSQSNPDLRTTINGARILAYIREHSAKSEDIRRFFTDSGLSELEFDESIAKLQANNLISSDGIFQLTSTYIQKEISAKAKLDLAKDQFLGSLRNRITNYSKQMPDVDNQNIEKTVFSFFEDICKEHGLGVAQNLVTTDSTQISRRTASLIQTLPSYLKSCSSRHEVFIAISVSTDILTSPTSHESKFMGFICQAYFGKHLLGTSENLAKIDLKFISGTCYILDASVLICLLAENNDAYNFTCALINDLHKYGALVITTDLLIDEISEHANWPIRLVDKYGELSQELLDAVSCKKGYRPNQFLRGYYLGSPPDPTFYTYISRVLKTKHKERITHRDITNRLSQLGIRTIKFGEWSDDTQDLLAHREEIHSEISTRRRDNKTFKHERQTKAEAEVALIVDGIRNKTIIPPDFEATDSFFLSSTRVVDKLPELERRICLRPEGLAQWIWSAVATSDEHAKYVFEQLLWEISYEGIEFLDRSTLLRKFSGIIEASKIELQSSLNDRREYLIHKYGPDPETAFNDADPLDIPRLNTEAQKETIKQMQIEINKAKQAASEARKAELSAKKNHRELLILRNIQKQKKKLQSRKEHSALSNPNKRKKKRKK